MKMRQRPYHQKGRWVPCPACQRMYDVRIATVPPWPAEIRCASCCQNGPVRNARFWNYGPGGWVKITLRPGQELGYAVHHRTEEGWSAQGETFRHDAEEGRVVCEWWTDGADCDGRLSREGECSCPLDRLAVEVRSSSEDRETRDILAPAWERGSASQRDYQAEAAGY